MEKIEINGAILHYEIYGTGKKDLIFIHGYSARGNLYRNLFKEISAEFRVFALDLRGHGESECNVASFTLNQMADDIVAFSSAMGLVDPIFAGHSLGGLLGLISELRHPTTFDSLILINPAVATGGDATPAELAKSIVLGHRKRQVMRKNYEAMYVKPIVEEDITAFIESSCLVDPVINQRYFEIEYPKLDIADQLALVTSSVLILNGAKDEVVYSQDQHQLALSLNNYKEVIFSDEGHLLPLENPNLAAREMIMFAIGRS